MANYEAIVMGGSAGGYIATRKILSDLPPTFILPLIVTLHRGESVTGLFTEGLSSTHYAVKEAEDKEAIRQRYGYFAPSGYHLLVEQDKSLALSSDEKENFARPSIDVLFESAARVYHSHLIAILLSGASIDGALGIELVKRYGGLTIVQDPNDAEVGIMPQAALERTEVDHVVALEQIGPLLSVLSEHRFAT